MPPKLSGCQSFDSRPDRQIVDQWIDDNVITNLSTRLGKIQHVIWDIRQRIDDSSTELIVERWMVDASTVITANLPADGGQAIRLVPESDSP